MEEDELLQRELGGDSDQQSESIKQNQGSQGQVGSNGNTTIDSNNQAIKPPANTKKQSKNCAKAQGASTKSTKQSNIADWMNSSNSAKNNQLVGQKRTTSKMTAPNKGPNGKVSNHKGISEFEVENK